MTRRRVLVADRDRRTAGVLSWLLAESGFDASIARPPLQESLRWHAPDVLILDADDADQVGEVDRLRGERWLASTRVIAACRPRSGIHEDSVFDDVIEKPYRPHEVLARVHAQVRMADALRRAAQAVRPRDAVNLPGGCLLDAVRHIVAQVSVADVCQALGAHTTDLLGVRDCMVVMAGSDDGARATVLAGTVEREPGGGGEIELEDYPEIARAIAINRVVHVEDATMDGLCAAVRRRAAQSDRAFDIRSSIAVPFGAGGHAGALLIRSTRAERALTRDDVEVAEFLVSAGASSMERGWALEAARLENQRLEQLATTDALTRLLNRRALSERLAVEMDRARRFASHLAIMLVDLDHFKSVNDTFGHLAGDEVLRQIGALLQHAARTVDVVARYGGEEFVIILPETGVDGARIFADRVCDRIGSHHYAVDGRVIRLTVSVGLATFPAPDVASADDFFARADAAMYRAKREGRNQVRT